MKVQFRLMAALAASIVMAAPAVAHDAHKHGAANEADVYGQPGDPKKPARDIVVSMSESDGKMLYTPSLIEVRKGEQVRFKVQNPGALEHELVIGTQEELDAHADMMLAMPDMQHEDPNAIRLASKASGDLLWQFTNAGEFPFACLIPGHREAGMVGKIVVR